MLKYRLAPVAAALSAFATAASGQPAADDRDMFVDSYEGRMPDIDKFVLEGDFGSDRPFRLEVVRRHRDWNVYFEQAGERAAAVLPIEHYSPLHFSRIVIATRSQSPDDPEVIVTIPFGEPEESCFANGRDVFSHVILSLDRKKPPGLEERIFDNCEAEYRPLRQNAR